MSAHHRKKHPRQSLYIHQTHAHTPQNTRQTHSETMQHDINMRIAVWLTKRVGSMLTAYLFGILAIIGLFALLDIIPPTVALLVAWASQTFIQLVLLPVIMVGQNVLDHQQGLQAEEQYETTVKIYHDSEQMMRHMQAQDTELLQHSRLLVTMQEQIAAIYATTVHLSQEKHL